jgi:predicted CopG family antitoxin
MSEDDTSIRIKNDTWQRLNARKAPGKSFDDIINEILDELEEGEEGNLRAAGVAN